MLRRIGVLASLAVVAAMFVGSSTAQAQTAGVCVFTGLAGTLTPDIPNAVPDLLDLNPVDIERGAYTYSSSGGGGTAACAGLFNGAPQVRPDVIIDSAGGYDNLLCGTGFAHDADGNQTVVRTADGAIQIGPGAAGYQIPFVAGVGPLLIGPKATSGITPNLGNVVAGSPNAADPPMTVTSSYTGAGLVQITPGADSDPPQSRDNCITPDLSPTGPDGDTGSFQVKGFFIAENVL